MSQGRLSAVALHVLCGLSVSAAIHVSGAGNDENSGSAQAPVRSLEKALEVSKRGNEDIVLHGGEYTVSKSLLLPAGYGGTAERPLVWRAADGEKVVFTGGRVLTGSVPLGAGSMPAVPESRRKFLRKVEFAGLVGDISPGEGNRMDLFYNNSMLTLARDPNDGWLTIADVPQKNEKPLFNGTPDVKVDGIPAGRHFGTVKYDASKSSIRTETAGVWLAGYFRWNWYFAYQKTRLVEPQTGTIALAPPYAAYGFTKGQRFAFVNSLEALDSPGEWFFDEERKSIVFWPPSQKTDDVISVSALKEPMVVVKGASHIRFQGIHFAITRGNAMTITDGSDVGVEGCEFRNIGETAVVVTGGQDHLLRSNNIFEVGASGVRMEGGDRRTLGKSNHRIVNNHIHHFARTARTFEPAILVRGVGIQVEHNLIHDGPHVGIMWAGNDITIEKNEVHHVVTETGDAGALYSGRNLSFQGITIRHNYIHDITGLGSGDVTGIYLDDGNSGHIIYGNVLANIGIRGSPQQFGSVFVHGGKGNKIENNIFVNCNQAFGQAGWDAKRWTAFVAGQRRQLHQDIDIENQVYRQRFPLIGQLLKEDVPNVFSRNLVYQCGSPVRSRGLAPIATENWVTNEDPGFDDVKNRRFGLRGNSTVRTHIPGFTDIPFGQIGLTRDQYRADVR